MIRGELPAAEVEPRLDGGRDGDGADGRVVLGLASADGEKAAAEVGGAGPDHFGRPQAEKPPKGDRGEGSGIGLAEAQGAAHELHGGADDDGAASLPPIEDETRQRVGKPHGGAHVGGAAECGEVVAPGIEGEAAPTHLVNPLQRVLEPDLIDRLYREARGEVFDGFLVPNRIVAALLFLVTGRRVGAEGLEEGGPGVFDQGAVIAQRSGLLGGDGLDGEGVGDVAGIRIELLIAEDAAIAFALTREGVGVGLRAAVAAGDADAPTLPGESAEVGDPAVRGIFESGGHLFNQHDFEVVSCFPGAGAGAGDGEFVMIRVGGKVNEVGVFDLGLSRAEVEYVNIVDIHVLS